jgi:hypothetical protein
MATRIFLAMGSLLMSQIRRSGDLHFAHTTSIPSTRRRRSDHLMYLKLRFGLSGSGGTSAGGGERGNTWLRELACEDSTPKYLTVCRLGGGTRAARRAIRASGSISTAGANQRVGVVLTGQSTADSAGAVVVSSTIIRHRYACSKNGDIPTWLEPDIFMWLLQTEVRARKLRRLGPLMPGVCGNLGEGSAYHGQCRRGSGRCGIQPAPCFVAKIRKKGSTLARDLRASTDAFVGNRQRERLLLTVSLKRVK